ncbi:MAG TPA: hypothetical protein VLJ39_23135 [Tepidisphaeraceae bacterium]|nr:hypothetical protein [Tepidisphaeraceae bacterium]
MRFLILLLFCSAATSRPVERPDDPELLKAESPALAQLAVQRACLQRHEAPSSPIPEIGFYVYSVDTRNNEVSIDDYAGHALRVPVGAEIPTTGWEVVTVGHDKVVALDHFIVIKNRKSGEQITLWEHLLMPLTNEPVLIRWEYWQHHQNEALAIRMRAEHRILVIHKPNSEPNDRVDDR